VHAPPYGVSADWARLRKIGFATVIHSGWPAFQLLRLIQQQIEGGSIQVAFVNGPQQRGCDSMNTVDIDTWLNQFKRDSVGLPNDGANIFGVKTFLPATVHEAVDLTGNPKRRKPFRVCPLLYASYYLLLAAVSWRNRYVSYGFWNDGMDGMDIFVNLSFPEIFLHKSKRYVHNIYTVLNSRFPVLTVLGQLGAVAMMHDPKYSYIQPFVTETWSSDLPLNNSQKPTIVEAGAHDWTDSTYYAAAFPSAEIWAFEAHPSVFLNLK